jgi:hypothetical protein
MRSGSGGSGQLGVQQVPASALLAGALMPSPYPAGAMRCQMPLVGVSVGSTPAVADGLQLARDEVACSLLP